MRLLFLTIGKTTTPSTRFRVKQYLSYLKDDGITADIKNIPHAFYKRFKLFCDLAGYDAVIVQKKLFSALELALIRRANQNIIYDFDDLVTAEHPMHELTRKRRKRMAKNKKRFVRTLREARGVIAGNSFLQNIASRHNDKIIIVPTPVETNGLPVKEHSAADNLIIGWIGTKSNLFYLDRLKELWKEIAKRFPNVTLKIVCNAPYKNDDISVINKEWRADDETGDLMSFDIGIMPLTDDEWSKGKCGFKLLQYMAVGLPTVASDIGANCEITGDGENGYLASNDDEWVEKLSRLLTDAELRRTMGARARARVEERYSVRVTKDILIRGIKEIIGGQPDA